MNYKFDWSRSWPNLWLWSLILISILFLFTTGFRDELWEISPRLVVFNLGRENNVATWWSGMLLFIAGMHAFDGYYRWSKQRPKLARGWVLIAGVMFFLSMDEVGSIHERAKMLFSFLPESFSWLPIAIPLGLVSVLGLYYLWQFPDQRMTVWLLIIGFAMFGTVIVQEIIEITVSRSDYTRAAVRVTIEEGSEIVGILVIIRATMSNSGGIFDRQRTMEGPAFAIVRTRRLWVFLISLLLIPLLSYVSCCISIFDQDAIGQPSRWFAAILFFAAGATVCERFLQFGENIGTCKWLLALFSFLMSITAAAIPSTYANIPSYAKPMIFALISMGTIVAWIISYKSIDIAYILVASAILITSSFSLAIYSHQFESSLLLGLSGLAVYYINSTLVSSNVIPATK